MRHLTKQWHDAGTYSVREGIRTGLELLTDQGLDCQHDCHADAIVWRGEGRKLAEVSLRQKGTRFTTIIIWSFVAYRASPSQKYTELI